MTSEREIAIEHLKAIQKNYLIKRYGLDFERELPKFDLESLFQLVENNLNAKVDLTQEQKYELEAQIKNSLLETEFLNTEYESPVEWQIISSLFEDVKKILPTDVKLPYIGTVASGDINAEAYSIKGTEIKLMLFESELFTCASLLCKVIAQSIPLTNDEDSVAFSINKATLEEHLKNTTLTKRFNDFFYNSVNHRPSKSEFYPLEKDRVEFVSLLLLESLEFFVIGHEYGHIYLGHLDTGTLNNTSLALTNRNLLKINPSWEEEFQADNIGAQVLLGLNSEGEKFPFSLLGPELLFNFFHYKNIFSSKNPDDIKQESDSHPAPIERKKRVREYILNKYVEKDQEILKSTYKLIDDIFLYHIENYNTNS